MKGKPYNYFTHQTPWRLAVGQRSRWCTWSLSRTFLYFLLGYVSNSWTFCVYCSEVWRPDETTTKCPQTIGGWYTGCGTGGRITALLPPRTRPRYTVYDLPSFRTPPLPPPPSLKSLVLTRSPTPSDSRGTTKVYKHLKIGRLLGWWPKIKVSNTI